MKFKAFQLRNKTGKYILPKVKIFSNKEKLKKLIVWSGDRPMSPKLWISNSSPVANYQPIPETSVLSKVFERLVSVRLGRFVERSGVFPAIQFAYRSVCVTVMLFFVYPIHCKYIEEWVKRLGLWILTSALHLRGSTIRVFSLYSDLWVLEVLCCLYCHSICQIDHCSRSDYRRGMTGIVPILHHGTFFYTGE